MTVNLAAKDNGEMDIAVPLVYTDERGFCWPVFVFMMLNLLVLAVSAAEAFKARKHRSFRLAMALVCCAGTLLRVVVCTAKFQWSLFTVLLWTSAIPTFLQFLLVSLLILFLVRTYYRLQSPDEQEMKMQKVVYPVFAGVVVFLAMFLVFVCTLSAVLSSHSVASYDRVFSLCSFSIPSILLLIFVWYVRKINGTLTAVFDLSHVEAKQVVTFQHLSKLLAFVLLLRSLWSLAYILDINPIQTMLGDMMTSGSTSNLRMYDVAYLLFYGILETLPMAVIIFRLNRLPHAAHAYSSIYEPYPTGV